MFVYNLNRDTVAKIWDLFFYGNGQQELFRVSLAFLKILKGTFPLHSIISKLEFSFFYPIGQLLKANMEEILRLLKKKLRHISPKEVLSETRSIHLSNNTISFLNSIEPDWVKENGIRKLIVKITKPTRTYMLSP
jgi:hypothetical protein